MSYKNDFGKFNSYTPEMLVYYHALAPELQNAVAAMSIAPQTIEELSDIASNYANKNTTVPDDGVPI